MWAPSFQLIATCVDEAGNESTVVVDIDLVPPGLE
jgi:hypothetical protein